MAEVEKNIHPTASDVAASPKPGDTIVPAGAPRPAHQRVSELDLPAQQEHQPEPAQPPPPIAPPTPVPSPQLQVPAPVELSQMAPVNSVNDTHAHAENDGSISWTASEFVAHEKSASWYGALALIAVLVIGLIYLLTKDIVSSVMILFCAAIFGIYAARKPKQLQYRVGDQGISIGHKHYSFQEFQSFTVAPDGAFSSIIFRPLKRFATLKTIYYAPEDEELIIDVLLDCLPFEEHAPDAVDRLMHRIRF